MSGRALEFVEFLCVPDDAVRATAEGWASFTVEFDADRAFACEFAFAVGNDGRAARALRVCTAVRMGVQTVVAGWLVDLHPPAPDLREVIDPAFVAVAAERGWLLRSAAESRALLGLRRHWDDRYARPERIPLDRPSSSLRAWAGDIAGRVLLLGDGEGRNVAAFALSCEVTVVELSPVGAAACERRSDGRTQVVCADLFRWLPGGRARWDCVAMLYVGPITDGEFAVLANFLLAQAEQGARLYLEFAAVALRTAQVERLARLPNVTVDRFRRGSDDIDRVLVTTSYAAGQVS